MMLLAVTVIVHTAAGPVTTHDTAGPYPASLCKRIAEGVRHDPVRLVLPDWLVERRAECVPVRELPAQICFAGGVAWGCGDKRGDGR